MIIDKIDNISIYNCISEDVLDFIKNLNKDIPLGRYNLSGDSYVNVETYMTKTIKDGKFEAHRDYIDIQILLNGSEKIYYTSVDGLTEHEPYNADRDIVFYNNDITAYDSLTLDGTNFAMIFPHEAHAPQIAKNIPEEVKKVVLKVKI